MPYPQRKSPRLQGYDYAQAGAYFVTICTHERRCLFGQIENGEMHHSPAGEIAVRELIALPTYQQGIDVDLFVVMPNHVHVILILSPDARKPDVPAPALGQVIGNYKAGVTRRTREGGHIEADAVVWQRSYHDHIIRDETGLNRIRDYVMTNPARWQTDTFFT